MDYMAKLGISISSIEINLKSESKEELIDKMILLLSKTNHVKSQNVLKQDLMHRESLGSTDLGEMLSLPHAFSAGVDDFCAALAVTEDKKICLLTAWNEHTSQNLKRMATLIEVIQKESLCKKLIVAQKPQEIYDILSAEFALSVRGDAQQYGL